MHEKAMQGVVDSYEKDTRKTPDLAARRPLDEAGRGAAGVGAGDRRMSDTPARGMAAGLSPGFQVRGRVALAGPRWVAAVRRMAVKVG